MTESINQKEKVISVSDRKLTIKELNMDQIFGFGEEMIALQDKKFGLPEIRKLVESYGASFTDWPSQDLLKLAPSQFKQIFAVFKEVNADFLETLDQLGVLDNLKKFKVKGGMEVLPDKKSSAKS